jgi:hypothetical protein
MTTVCKCIYVSMYVYSIPARTGVCGPPRPKAACMYVRYGVLRRDHSEHGRPRLMAMILVGCVCTSWFACIVLFLYRLIFWTSLLCRIARVSKHPRDRFRRTSSLTVFLGTCPGETKIDNTVRAYAQLRHGGRSQNSGGVARQR